MKRLFWGAIALTLALAGCVQAEERADGGRMSADQPAGETATSGALAEAFVEAARVHAMVARNNTSGATTAVNELRTDLELAKENAPLEVQSRINELDQLAIQTQQAIDTNPSGALQASSRLIDEMQVALGGAPSELSPSGGGAGVGPHLGTPEGRDAVPPNDRAVPPAAPDRNAPDAPINQAPGTMNGPGGTMSQPAPGTGSGTGAPANAAP
jgi:hypothetical protein